MNIKEFFNTYKNTKEIDIITGKEKGEYINSITIGNKRCVIVKIDNKFYYYTVEVATVY